MTERIEFGSKAAADSFREKHKAQLWSDDDRRLKTVATRGLFPTASSRTGFADRVTRPEDS